MTDVDSTAEIESDVEICVVDDEDDSTKEIVRLSGEMSDDEGSTDFGQINNEDKNYVQIEEIAAANPLSVFAGKRNVADDVKESERGDEETMHSKV